MNRLRGVLLSAALTLVAAGVTTGTFGSVPALAAPGDLPAGCTLAGVTATCTYAAQGETQFTVPSGVTSIDAIVTGAQGGGDFINHTLGGLGATVNGRLSVTGGDPFYLDVDVLGAAGGVDGAGTLLGGAGGGLFTYQPLPPLP